MREVKAQDLDGHEDKVFGIGRPSVRRVLISMAY
jgi:hypothetical protein